MNTLIKFPSKFPLSKIVANQTFIARKLSTANRDDSVGFVGLGNMGGHMARNLLTNGHRVVVCDRSPKAVQALVKDGASSVSEPREVASLCRRVVTMLPTSSNVLDVYHGSQGLLSSLGDDSLCVDSSTIDQSVAAEVGQAVQNTGAMFVDAPVSGGVNAARDATLTFMVGGSEDAFKASKQLLDFMGKNVIHTGAVGTGQAAKICNNMLLGISMIGTAETMNLGVRLGIDAKMLAKILNISSGRCWSSELYNPCPGVLEGVPASNGYKGGFGAALMTKDLGLAQNAATNTKTPTPLGSSAHQLYRLACNAGYSDKDFSSVYAFLQEQQAKPE